MSTRELSRHLLPAVLLALSGMAAAAAGAAADVRHVPGDYPTIQSAVDAATPGDTVVVSAGTYTEEVVIDKDLELRGAGVDSTVLASPATLTPYGVHLPDGRALTAIVRVDHGARVRIDGLTVRGPIPCGVEVTGINALRGATLDLRDARVTDIQPDAATCAPRDAAGRAVVYGTPPHVLVDGERGSTAYGRLTRVVIDRYQHAGVSITGPHGGARSRVTVEDNIISGGAQIPTFQFGIEIDDGAAAEVTRTTITDNTCRGSFCGPDPINDAQGTGILLLGLAHGTVVDDNDLRDNDVGIYAQSSADCCTIAANTVTGSAYFGIVIQDGDGAAIANTISGGRVGIGVVADSVDTTATLLGDRIAGTSIAPVREIDCCGVTATAVVRGG